MVQCLQGWKWMLYNQSTLEREQFNEVIKSPQLACQDLDE